MQIEKEVQAVRKIFNEIEKERQKFFEKAPLHCPSDCTACCQGKNIAATALEFFPYAWEMFREGKIEDKYWEFKSQEKEGCLLLESDSTSSKTFCSQYENRGVICRLFGNSAMIDKNGTKQYSGCKTLKEKITDLEQFNIDLQKTAPVYSNYYYKLRGIDIQYGALLLPINIAILKSLEVVYYNTRNKRPRRKLIS